MARPALMRITSNRPQWMLIGTSMLAIAAAWLFTYWNAFEDREITRSTSARIVDSLAVSLEEHLGVTLRDARNAVYSAAVRIEDAGGFSGFGSAEHLHKELRRELHDNTSTARLIAVDGSRRIVASSDEYPLPENAVAVREAFTWHASHPSERTFHLGVPYKSAVSSRMVIPYSRAVFDKSGGMAGMVVAELSTEYLAGLYAALTGGGTNASVVVFNHDGIILMRVPYDEKILGRSATDPVVFRKQLEANGNIEFTSAWDGKTRYYSHRVMQRDPLLIAVGVEKEDVLAPAAVRTRHRMVVIGTATLVFIALVWLLVADLRRLAHGEEQLRESFVHLQELSRRLIEVEESERRNINRELHDRVGQNLSALNLSLGIMSNELSGPPPHDVSARLDDARMLLEITSKQVRDVMAELRPAALDDFGVLAALRHHCAAVSARLGLAITVEGKALDPRLPPTTETTLFRIVQEALNNVAKHARASEVKVVLADSPGRVTLTVTDDGVGFDAAQRVQAAPTYGIGTMHERAEAVGARLTIASAPGAGSRVAIEVARAAT